VSTKITFFDKAITTSSFEIYKPVFHIKVLWLMTMGGSLMAQGIHLPTTKS
jgi:hypothetical protein